MVEMDSFKLNIVLWLGDASGSIFLTYTDSFDFVVAIMDASVSFTLSWCV